MKKWTIAASLSIGVLALSACNSDDEIVAETEAGNITKEEFYEELKDVNGESTLQQLVTVKVLEDNYEVTDEELEEEISTMKEGFPSEEDFNTTVEQQFGGEEQLREIMYVSMLQEKAAAEDVEITEEDLQELYERKNTEIQAQHILLENEEDVAEVQQKIEDGEDFGELAQEYSTDTGSAENGGDLGYFSAGSMVPEFEEAAFSLEAGEISDPVQSTHGTHIIKVNDVREKEESIGEFEDVKKELEREILLNRVDQTQIQEKINKLIQDAGVQINVEGMEDLFEAEETEENTTEEDAQG
ncbi:peptidylprolyl isomerase [Oceanobacillus iheyensis]|uniref:Foldase protein PrsA n=1 Tax=Oceanobacillus iheyensis (strain DSM 14371 / CIP 107618 / JCM 11309 / KCTC 3954 / HTE831) TaxID=221109 RepID=PRSA_OCEIH|nr:peptidylprolyl isomerase [Oceanobacillus iheyensis]Q8CXK4.1 RecName: Full=Foldase protein PrsA; Flags: Precursor [Oceanobacillus iheyensis HTE831]BAC13104.1 protein secretion (post-translocation molecular chaperone) [Oceanobacillus iheyensis HTE831]